MFVSLRLAITLMLYLLFACYTQTQLIMASTEHSDVIYIAQSEDTESEEAEGEEAENEDTGILDTFIEWVDGKYGTRQGDAIGGVRG